MPSDDPHNPAWTDVWAALYDAMDMDRGQHLAFYNSLIDDSVASLLDLGCGTGSITMAMVERMVPGARVVGIDLAPKMIEVALERAPEHDWRVGDIADPPVAADETFDLITVCFNTLQLLLDPADLQATFDNAAARLAPGGRLAFDIAQPNPDFLARVSPEPQVARQYVDASGRNMEVIETDGAYDAESGILSGAWTLRVADTGEMLPLDPLVQKLRQYTPDDIAAALARAGLAPVERFGDLDRSPLEPGTRRQVYICTRG